jgi:glutamate 5-kinase
MRSLSESKRIVVKLGTNILTRNHGIDEDYIGDVATQVAGLLAEGRKLLLVTSGAIGMGAGELGIVEKISSVKMRQACASIGQPLLMHVYRSAFKEHGIKIAQVLLTREVLNNRRSYLNLRNSVETLLDLGVVPVFNENDSVSTAEIGNAFGDNDRLSALVASKVDADLLVILTDIDAFYTANPRIEPEARPIRTVEHITDEILQAAGAAGSTFSTGGMKTKVMAGVIAARAGCRMVLADGREPGVLGRILSGEEIGTLFLAEKKLSNRSRWIVNASPQGEVVVDEVAIKALRSGKSLLPSGIKEVRGDFAAGDVVDLNSVARIVVHFTSAELKTLMGHHSSEIRSILGADKRDVVARPEDIVFLDEV